MKTMTLSIKSISLYLFIIIIFSCGSDKEKNTLDHSSKILISNVSIVDVESGGTSLNQFVLIQKNLIHLISSDRPDGSFDQEIDGSGKYLMPGLINMYTHVNEDNLILYLANGQTTIKDAPSHLTAIGLRERIKAGELIGPRIFAVGLRATGMPAPYHSQQPVRTAEEAREKVRESKRLGYDGMFIYGSCDPDTYEAILDEASKLNFHISGHFPQEVELYKTLNRTQRSFDNLTGLIRRGELQFNKDSLINGMLQNGQAVTPTLTVHRLWSLSDKNDSIYRAIPKQYIPNKMKATWGASNGNGSYPYQQVADLIKEMYDKGVPVYIGSDGGYPMVVNGFSYHQELSNLRELGIPIHEILEMATISSAKFLNYEKLGLVKEGFLADLLLLEKNPLEDLDNFKTISTVFVNGKSITRKYLDDELEKLKEKIENPGDRFSDWDVVMNNCAENDSILHYSFEKNQVQVGEEKIRVLGKDNRNFSFEAINVMDGPDRRETYAYMRVRDRNVDSLNIRSVTPEGDYLAIITVNKTKALIEGVAPFHGKFSYEEPVFSGSLLLGPFTSRYFDLDIASNYVLAMAMKRSLSVGQADQLPVIQIELNNEEFGKYLIVDDSEYTIYRQEDDLYKIIYHGFSGYRTITKSSFALDLYVGKHGVPNLIREGPIEIKLK